MQSVQICEYLDMSRPQFLLIFAGSISIGGLCHHAWEMPIQVFEKHMLVRPTQQTKVERICINEPLELIHRCSHIYHMQRLQ